jgi:hypothetical protein
MTNIEDLHVVFQESIKRRNAYANLLVIPTKSIMCIGQFTVGDKDIDKGLDLTKIHHTLSNRMMKRLNIEGCKDLIFIPRGIIPQKERPTSKKK